MGPLLRTCGARLDETRIIQRVFADASWRWRFCAKRPESQMGGYHPAQLDEGGLRLTTLTTPRNLKHVVISLYVPYIHLHTMYMSPRGPDAVLDASTSVYTPASSPAPLM